LDNKKQCHRCSPQYAHTRIAANCAHEHLLTSPR
jgi:hypothetical protein